MISPREQPALADPGKSPPNKWLLLAVLATVSSLMIGGPLVSLNAYVPVIRAHEQWADAALEGTATAVLFFMSATGIVAGAIVDRFTPRFAILGGGLLAAAGCLIAATSAGAAQFIASFALIGVGIGAATMVPSIPILSNAFSRQRGLALGLYFGVLALAAAIIPPLTTTLTSAFGWRLALVSNGAAIALASFALLFLRMPSVREEEEAGIKLDVEVHAGIPAAKALRTARYWVVVAGVTLALISSQGVLFSVVSYLAQGGMPIEKAVLIFSVANFFSVPAAPLAGMLADRLGARMVAPLGIVIMGAGTLALLAVFAHGVLGGAGIAAYSVLWGMACVTPGQIGPMLLEDVVGPRSFGILLGVSTAVSGLISAFAPMATAILRATGWTFGAVFGFYGALCVGAALLLLCVRPQFRAAAGAPA